MKVKFIIACFLFTCFIVYTNVGIYEPGEAGVIYPASSSKLNMVDEKIDIDIYYWHRTEKVSEEYSKGLYYIEYKCLYRFKNEGKIGTYLLGYPIMYGQFYMGGFYSVNVKNFPEDYEIAVNGKKVEYEKNVHGLNPAFDDIDYDEVFSFPVTFKEKEEIVISIKHSSYIGYFDFGDDDYLRITYILKTAKTLSKPIGQAVISVIAHYPARISEIEKPGKYLLEGSFQNSDQKVVYSYKNLVPSSDFTIIPELDEEYSLNSGDTLTVLMNNITTPAEYSRLFMYYFNSRSEISLNKQQKLEPLLGHFITKSLTDDSVLLSLKGFLLVDNEFLNEENQVSQIIVDSVNKDIETSAKRVQFREQRLLNTLKSLSRNNIFDRKSYSVISKYFKAYPYDGFMPYYQPPIPNKLYDALSLGTPLGESSTGTAKIIIDRMKASFFPLLETLLIDKKTTPDMINRFLMESNMFGKIDTLYLEKIEYYIGILRKRGKDDSVAFMLNKMLASLFTVRGSWTNTLVSVSYALLSENRDLLRNGWYVMGNYWFGRNFENAIRCYRIGLSYGSTSPLWDAVIDELAGVAFNDSYIPEENKIGQKHTWHLDIPHPYPYTEDDIIHLYSSERLLSLKLEHWTSEGETNAPAYYLAYNMACAYSRLTKATEALSWLRVSFRLNPALKKLVQTDKDLLFLRENHRKELDLILK